MRHFPVFVDLKHQRVLVSGAGEVAAAKLRLLLKTDAIVHVFGADPGADVVQWAKAGRVILHRRSIVASDLAGARLVYAASGESLDDARVARLAGETGVLVNVVDNLQASEFITPAIVDRDPVVVAIGTEGTAPVLARQIKAAIEADLPSDLGLLARIGARFRDAARKLPVGRVRRTLWSRYFGGVGHLALERGGEVLCENVLKQMIEQADGDATNQGGHIALVGAGPGDPDLLTIKAQRALHDADVVLYDRLVDERILELARREALFIDVGKQAYGPSWKQDDINATAIGHAKAGYKVVRLKSGDPMVFGRADEELDAYAAAGVNCSIVPGLTSAVVGAARMKRSLTRRGRNSGISFLTAHDLEGYAEHDWRTLAAKGAAAAIYMGVKAARFVQGRLLIHGAAPDTPVTIVENISRKDERIVVGSLSDLPDLMTAYAINGPAIIYIGIAARDVSAVEAPQNTEANVSQSRFSNTATGGC